jgi:hypothetical protein
LPPALRGELESTRAIRHSIVHTGRRIHFSERGEAQRSVDTGRWIFNWLQSEPDRTKLREKGLALRSLGRRLGGLTGHLSGDGPVIDTPGYLDAEDVPAESAGTA